MNLQWEYTTTYITIAQLDVAAITILCRQLVESTELVLPGERSGITVGLGKYRDKDQALQIPLETLVNVMSF